MKTQWRDVSKALPVNAPPWCQVVTGQYTTFLEYDKMFFLCSDRVVDAVIAAKAARAGWQGRLTRLDWNFDSCAGQKDLQFSALICG
jgi:hypothetical protein